MNRKKIYLILVLLMFTVLSFAWGFYFWTSLIYEKTNILDQRFKNEIEKNSQNIFNENKNIEEKKITNSWKINNEEKNISFSWNEKKVVENFYTDKEKGDFSENKKDFYDMKTDSSLQKFVDNKINFSEIGYVPENLEKISSDFILDKKWNLTLRKEANEALQKMWKKFFEEFWKKIEVVSAYRSYETQVWIKKRWCPDNFCAKAWFSEHQSWLAIDFWSASSKEVWDNNINFKKYFSWLSENAANFWFHNTYQKWKDIDWYEIEPWHWRYVWVEFANYLKNNNLTIAEYYYKNN